MAIPTFLIIGAAKSGTSSLYAFLRQHPEVFTSEIKEPGFFAFEGVHPDPVGPGARMAELRRVRQFDDYLALFRHAGAARAIGEASTVYLYSKQAPYRIHHYMPDTKIVALLRDPADRAYSGYRYTLRDGFERLGSFEAALKAEPERIAARWQPIWYHTELGFYGAQLRRFYDLFGREKIRVYTYDEFCATPTEVMRDLFRFLGVDESFRPDMSLRHNVSGTPRCRTLHRFLAHPNPVKEAVKPFLARSLRIGLRRWRSVILERNTVPEGPGMAPATREQLVNLFRADVLELQRLIGRDLSRWLQTTATAKNYLLAFLAMAISDLGMTATDFMFGLVSSIW